MTRLQKLLAIVVGTLLFAPFTLTIVKKLHVEDESVSLRPNTASAATIINGASETLRIVTTTTSTIHYSISYVDYDASSATPSDTGGIITTATTTTALSAPGASIARQVKAFRINNVGTAANTVTVEKFNGVTATTNYSVTVQPGEDIEMGTDGHWASHDTNGALKVAVPVYGGIDGIQLSTYKVGAASEAVALLYGHAKDTGFPSAWVPGTPGVNGDALDCSTAADAVIAGAPYLPTPSSGNYYLTTYNVASSVAHFHGLYDLVWYNTGLAVTTTTAQAITTPTLPSRDQNGTNNGDGWQAAIYVTTATTNAGAVTNTTLSYTDSDGNAGNTATIASFPATAVAGAFIPFQLAAGDRGIRSIQSITLGTSYGGGAISLVLYRPLAFAPAPLANVGGTLMPLNNQPTGIKLTGACIQSYYLASATTATNTFAGFSLVVR